MDYATYQRKKGRSSSSIKRSKKHLKRFRGWLKGIGLKEAKVSYTDLLQYLAWERKRGIAEVTLRHYLRYVRWYYDYLIKEEKVAKHPFKNLNLNRQYRQTERVDLHTLLSVEELDIIYESYVGNPRLSLQSKVLLGLLIYQGLSVKELPYLYIDHVNLELGRLRIPQSQVAQGRVLELEAKQVLGLSEQITQRSKTESLLNYASASQASNSRQHLKEQIKIELRKQGHQMDFKNLLQLRRSRISDWVNHYNLRQVQYLAGHKWVHSTEAYVQADLEELQEQIDQYHPLQ